MSLENILLEKRSAMISQWRDRVFGSYAAQTQRFLKKEKNRFANPVGQIISENLGVLYDELTQDGDMEQVTKCLDRIIRIRAVQDFKPSQVVNFLFLLKQVIREEVAKNKKTTIPPADMAFIEDRIQRAALEAFDIYTECRQKLFEIRVKETQNQLSGLLRRANLTFDISDEDHES